MKHLCFALVVSSCAGALPAMGQYYPDTPMPNRPGCEILRCVPIEDGYRRGKRCFWRCRRQERSLTPPRKHRNPQHNYFEEPKQPRNTTPEWKLDDTPEQRQESPAMQTPVVPLPLPPPPRYEPPAPAEPKKRPEPPGIESTSSAPESDEPSLLFMLLIIGLVAAAGTAVAVLIEHLRDLAAARDDRIDEAMDIHRARERIDAAARDVDAMIERYRTAMRATGRARSP